MSLTRTMEHGTSYLRYRDGEERRTAVDHFEPLTYSDTLLGRRCAECEQVLHAGERVTLFAVGPQTRDDARRAHAGQWYSALAVAMHQRCAWPDGPVLAYQAAWPSGQVPGTDPPTTAPATDV